MAWLASGLDPEQTHFTDNQIYGNTGNNLDFKLYYRKGLLNELMHIKQRLISIMRERKRQMKEFQWAFIHTSIDGSRYFYQMLRMFCW